MITAMQRAIGFVAEKIEVERTEQLKQQQAKSANESKRKAAEQRVMWRKYRKGAPVEWSDLLKLGEQDVSE